MSRLSLAEGAGPDLDEIDRQAVASSVAGSLAGQVPAPDDRFRAVPVDSIRDGDDPASEGAFVRAMAEEAATMLDGRPADRILAWAAGVVPRFAVTSSFGADAAVLLHLVAQVAPDVPILFLDTGFHFDETLDFRRRVARDLGLTVLAVQPDLSIDQQAARYGADLNQVDPDACCRMRKTMPLRRALANFDGWATGVRRVQTPERAATPIIEARQHADRWLVKVAPLANWTDQDVEDYLDTHGLPRNPLTTKGYRSIGCRPCTKPTANGQDPRDGRWSQQDGKSECGIHLTEDGEIVRRTTTPG